MRLIRKKALVEKLGGCSIMTIWRYQKDAAFPKPIYLTEGGPPHWVEEEIDRWIMDRVALSIAGHEGPGPA